MPEGTQQDLKSSIPIVGGHFCGGRVHSGVATADELGLCSVGRRRERVNASEARDRKRVNMSGHGAEKGRLLWRRETSPCFRLLMPG